MLLWLFSLKLYDQKLMKLTHYSNIIQLKLNKFIVLCTCIKKTVFKVTEQNSTHSVALNA
jgi:hypothetical protein